MLPCPPTPRCLPTYDGLAAAGAVDLAARQEAPASGQPVPSPPSWASSQCQEQGKGVNLHDECLKRGKTDAGSQLQLRFGAAEDHRRLRCAAALVLDWPAKCLAFSFPRRTRYTN